MRTHTQYDSFLQETLLLSRHDKVMSVILIVDDVLQVNTCERNMEEWLEKKQPCFL